MKPNREKIIGYWTVRISSAFRAEVGRRARRKGLTDPEAILIVILHEFGSSSLVELARKVEHAHPSVLRNLDSLEKKGFAARAPHPQDRRKKIVSLTKKGQKIVPDIHKLFAEVHRKAAKGFSAAELDQLFSGFQRVAMNLGLDGVPEHPEIEK